MKTLTDVEDEQAPGDADESRIPEVAAKSNKTTSFLFDNAKMSYWSYLWRMTRRYVLCPESFILLVFLVVVYNTFVNVPPLWRRAKEKLGIPSRNNFHNIYKSAGSSQRNEDLYWPSDPNKLSWEFKSRNAAAYSIQGRRPHMEDRFRVHNNGSKVAMYGIFDGHGGDFVAQYAKEKLFSMVLSNVNDNDEEHGEILTKQILEVDEEILQHVKQQADISGSTALVAMVTSDTLTVANVGDSRGVMCDKDGKTVLLSVDHKPNETKEHQRIKDAGGFVGFYGVWRVAGILATSRALGDYPLKDKRFIIAEPDILTFNLREVQPKFIILATDGLWDCFSNEEAVQFILERLDEPHFGAKSLILQAYYRGSLDNITVMVIKFDKSNFETKKS
ncbi:protein phosphatase 1L-like [Mercenaria mercenaria]|uniref:protein phosphatase 1L-like n=1 Tax=Mercenaria mercenaria TaxID=6596 RepID=UPI00234FAF9A|nr:protein phosphatase 1L-like [Mercenaria mercenaria]